VNLDAARREIESHREQCGVPQLVQRVSRLEDFHYPQDVFKLHCFGPFGLVLLFGSQ